VGVPEGKDSKKKFSREHLHETWCKWNLHEQETHEKKCMIVLNRML